MYQVSVCQYPNSQFISHREMEIIRLISKGFSTPEIASKLYLSIHTIKSHRKNILLKMDARNVAHMVSLAFGQGLLRA